jgi:hypothetical protein
MALKKGQSLNDLKKAEGKKSWRPHKMERNARFIFDTETNGSKYRTNIFHRDDESHVHTTGEHDTAAQAKKAATEHISSRGLTGKD